MVIIGRFRHVCSSTDATLQPTVCNVGAPACGLRGVGIIYTGTHRAAPILETYKPGTPKAIKECKSLCTLGSRCCHTCLELRAHF